MEKPGPSIHELYQAYEDRKPNVERKMDLQAEVFELDAHLFDVLDLKDLVVSYDFAEKGKGGEVAQSPVAEIEKHILFSNSNGRYSFECKKFFIRTTDRFDDKNEEYPSSFSGEEVESILFRFDEGETLIGTCRLDHNFRGATNEWALNDRYVAEPFRGRGVVDALFDSCSNFVQAYADRYKQTQKITANIGQPSVLLKLLKMGYKPKTARDEEKIDRILNADGDLLLDYAWKKSGDNWIPNDNKDLYCFEKEAALHTEQRAFRVELEKELIPKDDDTSLLIRGIREGTENALQPTIDQLYREYDKLMKFGWRKIELGISNGQSLFAYCKGEIGQNSLWVTSGIHGDEPAGPIAIAQNTRIIDEVSQARGSVVLLPLCNPWGYSDKSHFPGGESGRCVSDVRHLIGMQSEPVSPYAKILGEGVSKLMANFPPNFVLDLHEDSANYGGDDWRYFLYSLGDEESPAAIALRDRIKNAHPSIKELNGVFGRNLKIRENIAADSNPSPLNRLLTQNGKVPGIVLETQSSGNPLQDRIKMIAFAIEQFKDAL